ncbi:condensation domain-containing protein [Chitinophaga rhizophila]|uniref:AMP-binding protein n=1 Tax=Chitinophaga rhizophila TaxID=2866212 RepID=A0ABS7G5W5_9BACT|nr:condensation domain-containing protein [Chitinophaga rhizophila]MBW8683029.1 AMP-binding protein [Chitinophaga rhizophila]
MDINELIVEIESSNIEITINDSGNLNVVLSKANMKNEALINKIRANKELLIKHIQEKKAKKGISRFSITPFQEGLVSFAKNNPDSKRYIIQLTFEADQPLSFESFHKACEFLISRHEILRSTFDFDLNEQLFRTRLLPAESLVCLRINGDEEHALRNKPFQISEESLIRFCLVDDKRIVLIIHHLVADVLSVQLLLKELFSVYSSLENGTPQLEATETMQFSSYVEWVLQQDKKKAKDHWTRQLKDVAPARLENVIMPDNAIQEETYKEFNLQYTLSAGTRELLRRKHIASSTVLNFLGGLVLSAYHGGGQFVWGNTITHRYSGHPHFSSIIGPLIATVPLVYDFGQQKTLLEALTEFQQQLLEARDFSYISLNEIYDTVKSQNLFSASFSFQDITERIDPSFAGAGIRRVVEESQSISHFPLAILVSLPEDAAEFDVSYRADLFPEATIRSIADLIIDLYNKFGEICEQQLTTLDIFGAATARALIAGTTTPAASATLLDLFYSSLQQYPSRVAVEDYDNHAYTFTELDEKSNHIANLLTDQGITGNVGIHLNYSVNLVASVLGALKAGCSIVSLEHGFPIDKLNWLAVEAGISAVLLGDRERTLFGDMLHTVLPSCKIISLPEELPLAALKVPAAKPAPSDICTLYYTSGSTGTSKIIRTSHENVLNGFYWLKDHFPVNGEETFCLNIRLSFSPSIRNIFESLSQGARLLVIPEFLYHNVDKFTQFIADKGVTRISLTPSFVKVLMENEKTSLLQGVRLLELRGEAAKMADVKAIKAAMPDAVVINRYGSTEASSTSYNYEYDTEFEYYPLGKPVYNTTISIIDDHQRTKPLNVVGEILIQSRSVSLGYMHPEDNKDTFLFGTDDTRTLKTGDLGFIDGEGVLHYIGRKNRMLKLRGYRIEPSEIEYNLEQFEDVKKAEVLVVDNSQGARLVAFCQVDNPAEFSENNLKHFLKDRIPNYTIPNKIVFMKEFPRTVTGKVDQIGLQAFLKNESLQRVKEPSTITEKRTRDVFAALMPDAVIALDEDLYSMGANSIVVMRAAYKLGMEFNIKLKGAELFTYNTIEKLSAYIDEVMGNKNFKRKENYHILNQREGNEHIFFLVPPLTGTSTHQALTPFVPENMDFVVFATIAVEEYQTLGRDMETLAGFYKNTILQLSKGKSIHMAGWSFGGSLSFEIALQLEALGLKVNSLILLDPNMYRPHFDDDNKQREDYDKIIRALLIQENIDPDEFGTHKIQEQMYHANQVTKKYRPSRKYSGDISLIKPLLTSPFERNHDTPFNGLREHSTGEIHVSMTKGNHMTMATGPAKYIADMIFSKIVW